MEKRSYTTKVIPLPNPPNAVRELRIQAGLSCAALARRIESDQATISRFELKGFGLSKGKIERMAREVFHLEPWQQIYDPTCPRRLPKNFTEESASLE